MGTKKSFIKGLAAGAVLAAAASLFMNIKRAGGAKDLENVAKEVKNRVADHAKRFGQLTKAAYNKIVETTIAEYRGVKALSEDDLSELKKELKAGWENLKKIVKK